MATARRAATDTVQLKLRIREELRRKLERAAAKREVSLNTEMVERLEASFAAETRAHEQDRLIDEIKGAVKTAIEATVNSRTDAIEWLRQSNAQLKARLQKVEKDGEETD
jgi:DNA-binding transcriptional regulator GbsR (MarR family)